MISKFLLASAILVMGLASCGDDAGERGGAADGAGADSMSVGESEGMPGPDEGIDTSSGVLPTESDVHQQIKEKFDRMGGMGRVTVHVDGTGGVLLEGTVATSDRRQTAEDVARAVPGIARVENRITVER